MPNRNIIFLLQGKFLILKQDFFVKMIQSMSTAERSPQLWKMEIKKTKLLPGQCNSSQYPRMTPAAQHHIPQNCVPLLSWVVSQTFVLSILQFYQIINHDDIFQKFITIKNLPYINTRWALFPLGHNYKKWYIWIVNLMFL